MSMIHAIFEPIATWFGFVGSCIGSPNGACVPFVAFLALGAAASAALAIVLLAYRSMMSRRDEGTARDEKASDTLPLREPGSTVLRETPAAAA